MSTVARPHAQRRPADAPAPDASTIGLGDDSWFELGPDPMVVMTADGDVISANAAFRCAVRFQVDGRRPPWGRVSPPDFVDEARQFEAPCPDGRIFEWRERRLANGDRIAIARDVSARSAAAGAGDRAKTALFATLTHELRTPLNGVLGMAGLLARTPLDANQNEFVAALRRSGEHLLDLITEILDFSRIEAGRIVLEDAPFSLESVLQEVIELLSPKAHDKRLELIARLHPDTPATLRGDAGRLRQILFNLVGNAVKFTDHGGVAVVAGPSGPGRVRIAVRDTGPGVPEDKHALIFEEFGQADIAHARMHGGTGLGLAIVRKLCATMGGAVSVVSRPGHGATFSVDLPFAPLSTPSPSRPLNGVRALLVTANPVLAQEGQALLVSLGAQAIVSTTPARCADVDVILLDHAAHSSAPGRLPNAAPLIVLAPQEERAVIGAYQARGAGHYLLKPLRRRSVIEQVLAVTARAPAHPGAAVVTDERERPIGAEDALSGLRVLVADDNPINALLARTLLARAGCSVQAVGDGQEAVNAVLRADPPFDLVLLDLRMPGLDGFSVARLIRSAPGLAARTPLIALTADASAEDRDAALAAGMDDFLTKPIDVARLVHAVLRFTKASNGATL